MLLQLAYSIHEALLLFTLVKQVTLESLYLLAEIYSQQLVRNLSFPVISMLCWVRTLLWLWGRMGVVKHLFRFLVMEEIFIGKSLDLGLKPLNFLLQIILHCNRLSFNMFYFSFMRILLLLDNTLQSLSFSQG
jgi:hypothetical protein